MSCVKKFHSGNGLHFYIGAVACYALVCYLLHCSFYLKDSMGSVNVVWSGLSVLSVALAGVMFFKEKIHFHDLIAGGLITAGMLIFKYTN